MPYLRLDKKKTKAKLFAAGYRLIPRMNAVWDQFCPVGAKQWNKDDPINGDTYPLYEDNLLFRDEGYLPHYDLITGRHISNLILLEEDLLDTQWGWLLHPPTQRII